MKPERQIRATYADILDSADPATIRVIGDLDALYTSAPTPATPPFNTLLATRARATSRPGTDRSPETALNGISGGGAPPRSRHGWLRQGFAFAGAALAFALVATLLVLLFRDNNESSTPGAQPTAIPAITATANEILYVGPDGETLFSALPNNLGTRVILHGDGQLRSPVWSPDGARVAFSGLVDGQHGVFVVNVDGERLQLVAEGSRLIVDVDIVWSPDGSQLAFRRYTASDLDGGNAPPGSGLATRLGTPERSDDQHIFVVNADGTDLRQLNQGGEVGAPAWSPDSQQLAFTQSAPWRELTIQNLVVVELRSGETRQITEDLGILPNPQWSPNGRQILFASGSNNRRDLSTVFVDGGPPNSGLRVLIDANKNETGGKWSPDGRMVAFYSTRDSQPGIWIVNADGTDPRRIAGVDGHSPFDWSPDGRQIAYAAYSGRDEPNRLFIVNADGSGGHVIADDLFYSAQPDWSPVLAPADTATPESTPPAAANTSTPSRLAGGPNPDQIAYTSIQDGNPEIYVINADGSGLTRLTDDPASDSQPAWSPDGARLAFVSDRDSELRLYTMIADGSDVRLVTEEAQAVADPVWSPDGEWIAFVAFTEETFLDIYIVHPDGSDLRRLTDWQGLDTDPAWSPTGQQIVYRSDSGQGGMDDIFLVNIDGSGRANLTNDVIPQREPQWSVLGSHIAFSHASEQVVIDERSTAFVEAIAFYRPTLQGGVPFQTTTILGSTPCWSPDGHYLAYRHPGEPGTSGTATETLHILEAGMLETLERGRIPGIEGAMLAYDWSPGGDALAVAITNVTADGNPSNERSLWHALLDGSAPVLLAEHLQSGERPAWRPDPTRTPQPSKTPPDLALPTATPDTREPSAPLTPNALDNMAPLQPGQERHFVFDIRADYRIDESSFLAWNVKGSERMLPDGTLQQYMIARDASNTVLIEYVNDGERWWWNQRGWIGAGTTDAGVVSLPEELRIAMWEPRTVHRALTTGEYEQIDERTEGDVHITRYQFEDLGWLGQQLVIGIESAYYEVYTSGDPAQVTRTRMILVTPDDEERPEYAFFDMTFTDVILIPAGDGPGNYVVPDAPAEGTLQYTPPATLPTGLTLERHYHDFRGGMEWLTLTSGNGISITGLVYPSRGSFDTRSMQRRAARSGDLTVATGFIAGGDIAWTAEEANGWPTRAVWDNGRYRIELAIGNVTNRDQWNEDDLVALIYALAGEEQD